MIDFFRAVELAIYFGMRALLALIAVGTCEAFLHARPRLAPTRSARLDVTTQLREVPVDVPMPAAVPADIDALAREQGLERALFRTFRGGARGKASTAKALFRKYGAAYLITSISLALCSYAACYLLVSRGVGVAQLLRRVGVHAIVSPKAGKAAIAYAVHKAASPIRFPPTVMLTPMVSNFLARTPAAPAEED